MEYHLEQLGDDRFQAMCQALLVSEQKDVQCFPLGQADGGRDAAQHLALFDDRRDFAVFQVKYVNSPGRIRDPHKWLVGKIAEELPKIRSLLPKGAMSYHLITNVSGTAAPGTGSIDRLQEYLDANLDIPAQAWWRDDIIARLNANSSVKWSFPEVLKATDLLGVLAGQSWLASNKERHLDTLRAFITTQFDEDENVRFKQVDLQNDLARLFVDVLARISFRSGEGRNRRRFHELMATFEASGAVEAFDRAEIVVGAAQLITSANGQQKLPVLVIEGGPGQGKSTLVQYTCQVHRMRILGKKTALSKVDASRCPLDARVPLRIDLREYATWHSGYNPFVRDDEVPLATGTSRHLEAFIAAAIQDGSGGIEFSVSDLRQVASSSSLLIALDGLDEIADLGRRQSVINEISSATRRLRDICRALQVVVTTRPSAFTGISEFPRRDFQYVELVSLGENLVFEYADKWIQAKRLAGRDASELRSALKGRMSQPHLRDLARNPMQLAILLSLLHTRGSSLPDKRTALYDIYVQLFLARESEKTPEVRDHQDILVDLHRYLAWILHARAESSGGRGRIDREMLRQLLHEYLISEGRDPELASALFTGFQRVVFLVERVEGTFEFEVQPLREYFAARFLYETSPYSPAGRERPGTMPDRFDALCRSPYWSNVTRFFAGCLSKGELPALVDRLRALIEDPSSSLAAYPRVLAAALLGDWVFNQSQRSQREVIEQVVTPDGFWRLMDSRAGDQEEIVLPVGCGRAELVDIALSFLASGRPRALDTQLQVCRLLQRNTTAEELSKKWLLRLRTDPIIDASDWIRIGGYLGVTQRMEERDLETLINSEDEATAEAMLRGVLGSSRVQVLERDAELYTRAIDLIVQGGFRSPRSSANSDLTFFSLAVDFEMLACAFAGVSERVPLGSVVRSQARFIRPVKRNRHDLTPGYVDEVIASFLENVTRPVGYWRTSLEPWMSIVEPLRAEEGESWIVVALATVAGGVKSELRGTPNLIDSTEPICHRTAFARSQRRSVTWWVQQAEGARGESQVALVLASMLLTVGPRTMGALIPQIDELTLSLGDDYFRRVQGLVQAILNPPPYFGRQDRRVDGDLMAGACERVQVLLATMSNAVTRTARVEDLLLNYKGDDRIISEFCVAQLSRRLMGMGGSKEAIWGRLVWLYRKFDAEAGLVAPVGVRLGESDEIPATSVREILETPHAFPRAILRLATEAYEKAVFETLEPMELTAKRQRWFDEP